MDDQEFPWEEVEASRNDTRLQAGQSSEDFRRECGSEVKCPSCLRPASELTWIYFSSPPWTWKMLCGREGWLVVCDNCHLQVKFFCTIMN